MCFAVARFCLIARRPVVGQRDARRDVLIDHLEGVAVPGEDEDLELLKLLMDTVPIRVFDTQLASAFAGYGYSLGYRDLVLELLGATLDKGETRSDWCRRPLSATQLMVFRV